jgi:hypothetical protein
MVRLIRFPSFPCPISSRRWCRIPRTGRVASMKPDIGMGLAPPIWTADMSIT